jgi:hypothetical protein
MVISQGTTLLLKHTEVLSTGLDWNVAAPALRVGTYKFVRAILWAVFIILRTFFLWGPRWHSG